MNALNYYSLPLTALVVFGLVAYFILRAGKPGWREYLTLIVLAGTFVGAWAAIHPRANVLSASAAEVVAQIGQGTPVLLEFQSPYCLACTAIKPTVDRLEADFQGRLLVLRVDVQSDVGRELAKYYDFQYTPTFLFFDEKGNLLFREVGTLSDGRVRLYLQQ